MTRHTTAFCEYRDFCQALCNDTQQDVVANLDHARQFALTYVCNAFTDNVEVWPGQRESRLRTRGHNGQTASFDNLRVAADRCGQHLTTTIPQGFPDPS